MRVRRTATTRVVADALGVSTATVQSYARQGRIPFSETPGGHRRFDVAEVQVALESDAEFEEVALLLTPLSRRGLALGSTPPHRARLSEMAVLTGSRAEGPETGESPSGGPAGAEGIPSALGQLLRCARSSHLESVGT